jgi:hypothetical protein
MRPPTTRDTKIWQLRQTGLKYAEIAVRMSITKGSVASTLYRIRHNQIGLPPVVKTTDHCRWIEGDPRRPGWAWCQEPAVPGEAWCAGHLIRVYHTPRAA